MSNTKISLEQRNQPRAVSLAHGSDPESQPCCDLHGRNCEQGGEECCERCTEAHHFAPGHGGVPCSNPDLSAHAADCQMLKTPPPGWPFDGFSCNCSPVRADAVAVAPAHARCRSRSPFGACGLEIRHGGPRHAVPIGGGVWFGYHGGGRQAVAVGYGKFHGRKWCNLPCYCAEIAEALGITKGDERD